MPNDSAIITEFVLERLETESISRCIQLTRAFARIAGDNKQRAELAGIAKDLDRAKRRLRKLTIRLKERRD